MKEKEKDAQAASEMSAKVVDKLIPASKGKGDADDDDHVSRRDRILNSAGRLFAERGYGAVGINEIGQGAGISGPGVYRHFSSKEDVLISLYARLAKELQESVDLAFKNNPMPHKVLERMVKYHAKLAIDERDLILVYVKEQVHLPEPQRSQALRRQREYIDIWVDLLGKLRGDLSPEARRMTAHGAIWLLNSVGYHRSYLSNEDQVRILTRMAYSALFA